MIIILIAKHVILNKLFVWRTVLKITHHMTPFIINSEHELWPQCSLWLGRVAMFGKHWVTHTSTRRDTSSQSSPNIASPATANKTLSTVRFFLIFSTSTILCHHLAACVARSVSAGRDMHIAGNTAYMNSGIRNSVANYFTMPLGANFWGIYFGIEIFILYT